MVETATRPKVQGSYCNFLKVNPLLKEKPTKRKYGKKRWKTLNTHYSSIKSTPRHEYEFEHEKLTARECLPEFFAVLDTDQPEIQSVY